MYTRKSRANKALFILLLHVVFHQGAQNCIKLKLLSVESTDTVNYKLEIKKYDNNTVSIVANILKIVPIPLWTVQLFQSGEGFKKVYFVGSIKSCELKSYINKIRLLKELASSFLDPKNGNTSLDCPLQLGRYATYNVCIPPETKFLRFLYVPKTIFTVKGVISSLLPNQQKETLATFGFNFTMFRTC